MENRIIRYVEGIIIDEFKLISDVQIVIDDPETDDYPQIQPFCRKLLQRAERSIDFLNYFLIEKTGRQVTSPEFKDTDERDEDFFEKYYTRLNLLLISYETLSTAAQNCHLPKMVQFVQESSGRLSVSLSDLYHLANGYESIIALKDLRVKLVHP